MPSRDLEVVLFVMKTAMLLSAGFKTLSFAAPEGFHVKFQSPLHMKNKNEKALLDLINPLLIAITCISDKSMYMK